MAASEHEGIIYAKDNVYGTIYLTIDSQDPISVNFFHGIKIKVMLGIIKPGSELKRLHPEGRLDKCSRKPWNISVGAVGGNLQPGNESSSLKKDMNVCSDEEKVTHKVEAFTESEMKEEVNESLDEDKVEPAFSPVELTYPVKNTNTCEKGDLVQYHLDHGRNTLTSEPQNASDNNSEKSHLSSQRKSLRTLRQKKHKVSEPKKVDTGRNADKKESNSKIKFKRLMKVNSCQDSKPISVLENKMRGGKKTKIKLHDPKKKRSAKWKLARQISCQYCLKVFENQQAYYDHKKTSRSEAYECSMCTKVFPFQAHLQAHIRAYHQEKKLFSNLKESASFVCDICGSEVKNMFALKKHLMFHTQEYFYSCCICGKQFVEPGTLNNHMITHKSGGMIRCKCCDQLFATRGALAKHKLALLEVKCHLCGQVFPNRTSRTQHYKVLHQNDILRCSKCTSMFSSSEELEVHMKKHNLYKKKQCKTCGKFFSRLEKHIVTHKAQAEIDESELFVCDKCPKKFTNRSSFQRHLTIHSQDKPYQCPSCPKKFADCGVLRKHLRRHLSFMPYECEVCGKKCKEPGNLKVHMRIHSDTKQFQCPVCPQAFNYKSSLEGHMRSRHSQNSNVVGLQPQVPEVRQEYDSRLESDAHESYRTTRIDPSQSQLCESSSWKLEPNTNQAFVSAPNMEIKQYIENRADVSMKPVYEGNGINPVNLMMRHTYQVHPMHINPMGDVASKHAYVEGSASVANVNLTSSYAREVNPGVNSQPHEDSSVNITSLDVTTLNMTSMNISLY